MLLLPHEDDHSKPTGDLGKVVNSFKSGFGSFLNVFKDDKGSKKPAPAKGKVGGSMMQQSHDESLTGTDRLSQSMMESSHHHSGQIDYQLSFAFLAHFQSPEEIYKYLIQVGGVIMNQKDKIA